MTLLEKKTTEIIHLEDVDIFMLSPGILVSHYKNETVLDMELTLQIQKAMGEIAGGKVHPHLFIACPGMTATKDVRGFGSSKVSYKHTTVSAIVCNSMAHRILGNFFIKVQQPPKPTKLFNEIDPALKWLKTYL